eukprot:1100744-Rhodomonas_salina.3
MQAGKERGGEQSRHRFNHNQGGMKRREKKREHERTRERAREIMSAAWTMSEGKVELSNSARHLHSWYQIRFWYKNLDNKIFSVQNQKAQVPVVPIGAARSNFLLILVIVHSC